MSFELAVRCLLSDLPCVKGDAFRSYQDLVLIQNTSVSAVVLQIHLPQVLATPKEVRFVHPTKTRFAPCDELLYLRRRVAATLPS